MHIVIAGGSGFVGKALQELLLNTDYEVTILTRSPNKIKQTDRLRTVQWLVDQSEPEKQLGKVDAIVNLAGESINGLRWTKSKKERILKSRIIVTKEINRIISRLEKKPKVLVNASAVGYYGMSEEKTFTEADGSPGTDFLAAVVNKWEKEARKAEQYGVRTVIARFGIVLGQDGALPLMAFPYKIGVGGTIGSGEQWVSWVHVADVAGMIQFAIEHQEISGPLNVTAPKPLKMKEFGKTIGIVLHRPHWLPVPSWLLKGLLGEMSEMLINGQQVLPKKAHTHGYVFKYPNLNQALNDSF
ncbi:TIGR01777 family oxidoreductase [Lederbergia lenta]|uniref:TIGR01777 family oxidoreductase n=1 Tax=Lederbergia lenta TaxID=1467 RepID=UPI00203EED86|nr:TIGR01777 family oxidoreductase [Lederbergia lenta]MCM3112325.1 TIGR01777 family oxidoreductase [Lederbergia lenta]